MKLHKNLKNEERIGVVMTMQEKKELKKEVSKHAVKEIKYTGPTKEIWLATRKLGVVSRIVPIDYQLSINKCEFTTKVLAEASFERRLLRAQAKLAEAKNTESQAS